MALGQWSTTAANNSTADPSINWQEGQAPSTVNDSARAMMAAIATWWQSAEWLNLGDTPTYVSGTQFTVPTNRTGAYTVGRRVRATVTAGTVYGTITASAYSSVTTVTLSLDSGALDNGLSEVDVGILNPANSSTTAPSLVGSARNLSMSVPSASASATLTADEIIVSTKLGGPHFCLANFSQTINLATTGAGGMDTGSAPASGFVALYAIYNPTTGASALLAKNATLSAQPSVYGGANMPAGYTASALISVWLTNGSSQFIQGVQKDRTVSFPPITLVNAGTATISYTSFSLSSAVPPNANRWDASVGSVPSFANNGTFLAGDGSGTGLFPCVSPVASGQTAGRGSIPIITAQTAFYYNTSAGFSTINCVGYTI